MRKVLTIVVHCITIFPMMKPWGPIRDGIRMLMLLCGILSVMVVTLFILGNFQDFLDTTQAVLLGIGEKALLLVIILGLYRILFILIGLFVERVFLFRSFAGSLIAILSAAAAAIGVSSIRVLIMPGSV